MRPFAILALLAALASLAAAEAQKATPPTPPKAPTKPVSTLKPTEAPAEGGITLICKDFVFGAGPAPANVSAGSLFGTGSKGAAMPYRDSQITYETLTVKDTSGAVRTIYAPTRIVITHEFKPSQTAIGSNGRGLASGECGTPNAVVAGLTGPAKLVFNNFPSVLMQAGRKSATDSGELASVNLPPCVSGLRSFRTLRQNNNEFVIAGAGDATCLK